MRAAAMLVVIAATSVHAAVDLNGKWSSVATGTSGFEGQLTCTIDIAPHETSLSISGSCELIGTFSLLGTFDPAAGTFTALGGAAHFCSSIALAGQVARDGRTFTGTFECTGPRPTTGTFLGSRCGNGVLDAGEQCDDGNHDAGDCCSPSCAFEQRPCNDSNACTVDDVCSNGVCVPGTLAPRGTICGDLTALCLENRCDGAGRCIVDPRPDGLPCNDRELCTTGDRCQDGICLGTPPSLCGPCELCDPRLSICLTNLAPTCEAPSMPGPPRRLRIVCHDGVVADSPPDPLCDVDRTADGVCTFASVCPFCSGKKCHDDCVEEPRYLLRVRRERRTIVGRRYVVLRCLRQHTGRN